jgi:hypothetical protein
MPLNINERFSVQTLLRDNIAATQSLSESVLVTSTNIFSGDRYRRLTADNYATEVPELTYPAEFKWLETHFGQELKPQYAGVAYWDLTDDPGQTGADIETAAAVITALSQLQTEAYVLHFIGTAAADITNQVALAQAAAAAGERYQTVFLTRDPQSIVNGSTTDLGARLKALSINNATVISHPSTATFVIDNEIQTVDTSTERPDAAIWGRMGPTTPGAAQFDYKALNLVTDANYDATARGILRNKGYNWVEQLKRMPKPYLFPGRSVTNREIRLQWGVDWFDINAQTSLANFASRVDLMAFGDDTFNAVEGIIREWGDVAIERRIIQDDLIVNLPDPDTFSAAVRATGVVEVNNAYSATVNSAVDGWKITGDWIIGGV